MISTVAPIVVPSGPGLASQPSHSRRVYVSFSADVNPTTIATLLAVAAQHANQGVTELYLLLSTPGGSVMDGINAYNVLRGMPFRLVTHNVGNVDSIGNVIFLAGEERYACSNSTFMFHGVGAGIAPNQTHLELKALRERLAGVEADNRRIAQIIAERASFADESEVDGLFQEARTEGPVYARDRGIIHDVRDVQIAAGIPVQQLVFPR